MEFKNNMVGKLTQVGQNYYQKAKDLSDTAKLNNSIESTERKINELYSKVGYEVYCAYRTNPLPEVEELLNQIIELHNDIDTYKKQLSSINSIVFCPECGTKVSKEMIFCSNCGKKLYAKSENKSAQCNND